MKQKKYSAPNSSLYRTALSTYTLNAIIKIGDNCKLNGNIIHCDGKVIIDNNCMFGPSTIIVDEDTHKVSKIYNEREISFNTNSSV